MLLVGLGMGSLSMALAVGFGGAASMENEAAPLTPSSPSASNAIGRVVAKAGRRGGDASMGPTPSTGRGW